MKIYIVFFYQPNIFLYIFNVNMDTPVQQNLYYQKNRIKKFTKFKDKNIFRIYLGHKKKSMQLINI